MSCHQVNLKAVANIHSRPMALPIIVPPWIRPDINYRCTGSVRSGPTRNRQGGGFCDDVREYLERIDLTSDEGAHFVFSARRKTPLTRKDSRVRFQPPNKAAEYRSLDDDIKGAHHQI